MEAYNRAEQWREQGSDRLREIVSLIDSLENRLQKVKTSLQVKDSLTRTSRQEQERELGMDLKLFLIGTQLELTECPSQISKIQSLISQLTSMLS